MHDDIALVCLCIVAHAHKIYKHVRSLFSFPQIFSTLLRPEQDWGPSSEEYRVDYKVSHNWLERLSFRTVNILNPSQEVVTLKFVKVVKM